MAYVRAAAPVRSRGRAPRAALGFFGVDDALEAAAAAKTAKSLLSTASSFFHGGASVDAMRQRRADFFGQAADVGSVTAARYLIGGTQNTASHEIPDYQSWINRLLGESPDQPGYQAMVTAQTIGQKWAAGIPDPGGTQSMIDDVNKDLAAIGAATEAAPAGWGTSSAPPAFTPTNTFTTTSPRPTTSGGTGRAQSLPAMTSTAPFNYTPYLIGIGGGLLALGLMRNR